MCVGVRAVTSTMIKKRERERKRKKERSQVDEEEEEQPRKLRTSCFSVCFVVLGEAMNE